MNKEEIQKLIIDTAEESARVKLLAASELSGKIADAGLLIAGAVMDGGKVLICGNGGSAADSQHMAAELVGRYLKNRDPLSAVALSTDTSILTSIANDFGFDAIFERQTMSLGKAGDVLVAISTSGNSANVIKAMNAAKKIGMQIVSLTGKTGGKMAAISDILLNVPSDFTPRIQESHSMIVHLLCEIIENLVTEK